MLSASKISPFLRFDSDAEQAVEFSTRIFGNSRIVKVARYGKAGYEFNIAELQRDRAG